MRAAVRNVINESDEHDGGHGHVRVEPAALLEGHPMELKRFS
jgi:hypothetical protein